jgi:hypothetical protein
MTYFPTLLMQRFLFFLFLAVSFQVSAQRYYNQLPGFLKANGIWVFGEKGGINLNVFPPGPVITGIYAFEQCASVSDSATGNLLFYAGSIYSGSLSFNDVGICWNRNHLPMPHGDSIKGVTSSGTTAQGYTIVPMIDTPGKYYLFSLNYQGHQPALRYSVVDMNLDGGLGDIDTLRKNRVLDTGALSEAMIAIPGSNCDVWLLVHAYKEPLFKAYRIHSGGIDAPVISESGQWFDPKGNTFRKYADYDMCNMAVSPDRSMISLVNNYPVLFQNVMAHNLPHTAGTHLFRFDPHTGVVSGYIRAHKNSIGYGNAFSPDNRKLYVWTRDFGWNASSDGTIRQYDLSIWDSAAIAGSATDIIPKSELGYLTSLRLFRDTIYVSSANENTINRINNPNATGTASDYQKGALPMATGQQVLAGLPTEVVYPFYDTLYFATDRPGIRITEAGPVLTGPEGFSDYIWQNHIAGKELLINETGTYWVKSLGKCHARVDTFHVGSLVGIPQHTAVRNVKIYPNPVGSILHIDTNLSADIRIMSSAGNVVMRSGPTNVLDISYLPEGLYWVLLTMPSGEIVKVEKIVKLNL